MLASVTKREHEVLIKSIKNCNALRVGETAVVSSCVHTIDSPFNGIVYINKKADAGQFFYKRPNKGEVIHIDIFHQIGHVSHKALAKKLLHSIEYYQKIKHKKINYRYYGSKMEDYIDIQTATGGGRLSGSGRYGKNKKVRSNHLNHCHITLLLHPNNYDLILYLVNSTEQVIKQQNLKLIAIENILFENQQSFKQLNEEFESSTDSLLHKEIKSKMDVIEGVDCQTILDSFTKDGLLTADWEFLSGNGTEFSLMFDSSEVYLDDIINKKFQKNKTKGSNTTSKMTGVKKIFNNKQKNVKQYSSYTFINNSNQYTSSYRSKNINQLFNKGSIAVTQTIKNALIRNYNETKKLGKLNFKMSDLSYYQKPKQSYRNFLFLFDYSDSMKGVRIKAACALIDKLLSWSRDKVAVISIQENNTKLQCGFTRNRQQLLNTVKSLNPFGLTPLAEGIELAYDYIKSNKFYKTEVVLISDGVPTVSRYGGDPVTEAEMEAIKLLSDNIKFTCVGVKPNQSIMKRIAKAGGGKLFITKDLSEDVLLQIFRREYEKINAISKIS